MFGFIRKLVHCILDVMLTYFHDHFENSDYLLSLERGHRFLFSIYYLFYLVNVNYQFGKEKKVSLDIEQKIIEILYNR